MKRQGWFWLFLMPLLTFSTTSVVAVDTHIGVFGTASVSCFSSDTVDYVLHDQPEGPGRSSQCDAGLDSLLGMQLDAGLSDWVGFGLQFIADRNEEGNYTPSVSVAQLRWQASNAMTLRFGRMPTPAFLHSENRQVRYALPWVRPPLEVYGLLPSFSHDGLEFIYMNRLGAWNAEWQGGVSTMEYDNPRSNIDDTYPVETREAYLVLLLQDVNTKIKIGYGYAETTLTHPDAEALFDILGALVPNSESMVDDLDIDKSPTHLFGLGIQHERGDWLLMGELAHQTIKGYMRDQYGAYVTLGNRFGPWMPYTTLARRWSKGPDSDTRAGFLQPQVDTLLASTRFDSTSLALGLSREIGEQARFKFQVDWIQPDNNSWGLYTNHSPTDYNYADPDSEWLYTVSLDFVF